MTGIMRCSTQFFDEYRHNAFNWCTVLRCFFFFFIGYSKCARTAGRRRTEKNSCGVPRMNERKDSGGAQGSSSATAAPSASETIFTPETHSLGAINLFSSFMCFSLWSLSRMCLRTQMSTLREQKTCLMHVYPVRPMTIYFFRSASSESLGNMCCPRYFLKQ